jgi:hypothetical protein
LFLPVFKIFYGKRQKAAGASLFPGIFTEGLFLSFIETKRILKKWLGFTSGAFSAVDSTS